jgi:hypothetical protein
MLSAIKIPLYSGMLKNCIRMIKPIVVVVIGFSKPPPYASG